MHKQSLLRRLLMARHALLQQNTGDFEHNVDSLVHDLTKSLDPYIFKGSRIRVLAL